jgi:hypothetical protein
MADPGSRSWQEAMAALREAAGELQGALGRKVATGGDEGEAGTRLGEDLSRLERAAMSLLSTLRSEAERQRTEIESSIDRERAERTASQMRAALTDLAGLASDVAVDIAGAAGKSLERAEPELKSALHALDDVMSSAASWVRATVDRSRDQGGNLTSEGRPPLDDL